MAKVVIGHQPELTARDAMEVFQSHFAAKYDIYKPRIRRVDFIVKQSGWRGVNVSLRQKRGKTYFEFTEVPPSSALGAVIMILFVLLGAAWVLWGVNLALGNIGRIGFFIGSIVGLLLGVSVLFGLFDLVFSRPSRGIKDEVKAFIENAGEFKEPSKS